MINSTWYNIYQQRYDWAKIAYSKFMRNFDSQLYSSSSIKDQIFISVYGPSQVGKTSLILELVGVSAESYYHVENVLRGERGYGRSSTSTIVRYRASENDYWFITTDSDKNKELIQLNDEQAKSYLSRLRSKMESSGSSFSIESITIFIPKKYLVKKSNNDKDIIIKDLPGVKADNDKERAFVLKVIKKNIEISDLVLMVTTIDNLGLIVQPENLELDELQDWMIKPHRFKVILTRFFSDASSYNFCATSLNKNGSLTKSDIRKHINDQINTHDNEWELSQQLYALELGQSWISYLNSAKEDTVLEHIKLIRESFFDELKEVIYSSNNPISRLAYGYQIGKVAEKIKEIKNTKAEKEIVSITEQIKKNKMKIQKDSGYIKETYKHIARISQNNEKIIDERGFSSLKTVIYPEHIHPPKIGNNVNELKNMLTHLIIHLNEQWDILTRSYSSLFKLPEFRTIDEVVSIQSKLDSYKLSSYWIPQNYEEDLHRVIESINNQVDELNKVIYQYYNGYRYGIYQKNLDEIKTLNNRIYQVKQRQEKYQKRVINLQSDLTYCKSSLKKFNEERDQEIEHSKNFTKYIEPEFKDALNQFSKKAMSETDEKKRIYWILLLRLIKIDFETVKGKS
ncbi:hypothetical protein MN210_18710 [Psychrobacter raelei]|uniref:G domain-containing protein n=1 Tax=Psychrobacter raelei TaxID=2565531 RepID=A0AAU6PTT1_9GAMM